MYSFVNRNKCKEKHYFFIGNSLKGSLKLGFCNPAANIGFGLFLTSQRAVCALGI